MTAMTQTNHAIHLSRHRLMLAVVHSPLRPGDGERLAGQMMTGTINAINKKTGVFGITYSQQR